MFWFVSEQLFWGHDYACCLSRLSAELQVLLPFLQLNGFAELSPEVEACFSDQPFCESNNMLLFSLQGMMLSPSISCSASQNMGDILILYAGASCVSPAYNRMSSPMTGSMTQPMLGDSITCCGLIQHVVNSRMSDHGCKQACIQALTYAAMSKLAQQCV